VSIRGTLRVKGDCTLAGSSEIGDGLHVDHELRVGANPLFIKKGGLFANEVDSKAPMYIGGDLRAVYGVWSTESIEVSGQCHSKWISASQLEVDSLVVDESASTTVSDLVVHKSATFLEHANVSAGHSVLIGETCHLSGVVTIGTNSHRASETARFDVGELIGAVELRKAGLMIPLT
jgi:hypothetical protein